MSDTAIQKTENQQQLSVNIPQRQTEMNTYTPLVDIMENEDAFLFQADLPGVKSQDVEITYQNGVLTLAGKVNPRQPQQTSWLWQEYGVGHFYRQFNLNTPINVDGITAQLRGGVLEVSVPKADAAKPRRIKIKTT